MPGPEDFGPKPNYRRARYSDRPEFKEKIAEIGEDSQKDMRLAMMLLIRHLGPQKSLAKAVADLLDEHTEYKIRLGESRPLYGCNIG